MLCRPLHAFSSHPPFQTMPSTFVVTPIKCGVTVNRKYFDRSPASRETVPQVSLIAIGMVSKTPLMILPFLFSLIIEIVLFAVKCSATCYGLDGNIMSPDYQPCTNIDGAISTCCATNRTNHFGGSTFEGLTADKCLSNGLCQNVAVFSPSVIYTEYWRDGCTTTPVDPEHCLKVCIDPLEVVCSFAVLAEMSRRRLSSSHDVLTR